jgi:hypothetical protein
MIQMLCKLFTDTEYQVLYLFSIIKSSNKTEDILHKLTDISIILKIIT